MSGWKLLSPILWDPIDYRVRGILQATLLKWAALPFFRGSSQLRHLPNPGIERGNPALQADSVPAEPQGKPKNTEVGSLSLLQQIFPTQASNRGLLHCKQILYQLSYQGIPELSVTRALIPFMRVAPSWPNQSKDFVSSAITMRIRFSLMSLGGKDSVSSKYYTHNWNGISYTIKQLNMYFYRIK